MAIEAISNPSSVYQSIKADTSQVNKVNPTKQTANTADNMENNDAAKTTEQGGYEVEKAIDTSPEKVKKAVDEINQKIKLTHTSCQFSYHEETNRISIKVIDDASKKVIREIPPEKTLDMIAKTLELEGLLVDEKR